MRLFLTILALAYAVCPFDLLPDWLVGFGWIDDITILGLLWWYLYRYSRRRINPQGGFSSGGTRNKDSHQEQPAGSRVPRDPYQILEIGRNASQEEVKQAYKRLAGKYHPDKVSHLGEEFQRLAEKRFKEIQEAYEALKVK
jgi:hypothetical protein